MSLFVSSLGLLALSAYMLAVPVVLAGIQGWSGYDLARLLQWPLMLWAAAALAWRSWPLGHRLAGEARAPLTVSTGAVVLALTLALIAVWRAPVPAMALRELALVCGCLALAHLVARSPSRHEVLLRVTVVAAGTYALLITGLALSVTLAGDAVSRPDLFTGYDNHRYYSHVLTAALPLVLAAHLTLPGRLWRSLSAATLSLLGMMVFATGGRGTLLALVVAMVVVAAVVGRRGWPAVRPLALGLAVGLLGFLLLFVWPAEADPAATSALGDYSPARLASDQSRLPLWQHAIDMARASPWWGGGPMHFAHGTRQAAAHPHNLPLQIAAEWGLPMLALVGLFIGAMVRRAGQRLRAPEGASGLGIALSIGGLAVLLDSLVSGNFVLPVSQVWIAVLLGLFWAWLHPADAWGQAVPAIPTHAGPWTWGARSLALAGVALQVWLGSQMLPEAAHIGEHLEATMKAFPTARHQPRFWSHGLF